MAAFEDIATLTPGVWTQISSGTITAACVQNHGPHDVLIKATSGAQPTDAKGAKRYADGFGFDASVTLAQLFPGATGANSLWALVPTGLTSKVSISHA